MIYNIVLTKAGERWNRGKEQGLKATEEKTKRVYQRVLINVTQ